MDTCLVACVESGVLILQPTLWEVNPPVTVHSLLVGYDSMSVPVPGLSGVTCHIILYGKLSLILCNMARIKNRILVWSQVMQMMTVD